MKRQAELQGKQLQRVISQWEVVEQQLEQACRLMHDLQQHQPDSSITDVEQQAADWHRLQSKLAQDKTPICEAIEAGRHLLQTVTCPALDSNVSDLAHQLATLNSNINNQIKR